jgi:hypothetical protein
MIHAHARSRAPRPAPHVLEPLAEGPTASVSVCECGCLHIAIGAITLRMDPSAAASLCATLGEGIEALDFHTLAGAARLGDGRSS